MFRDRAVQEIALRCQAQVAPSGLCNTFGYGLCVSRERFTSNNGVGEGRNVLLNRVYVVT